MTRRLCYALLVVLAPAFQAAAQTAATPGGVTRSGIVTLGAGSPRIGGCSYDLSQLCGNCPIDDRQ